MSDSQVEQSGQHSPDKNLLGIGLDLSYSDEDGPDGDEFFEADGENSEAEWDDPDWLDNSFAGITERPARPRNAQTRFMDAIRLFVAQLPPVQIEDNDEIFEEGEGDGESEDEGYNADIEDLDIESSDEEVDDG